MSIFAPPLGLNPDPGTMNFQILGEVYMDIMDHTMHLLFYQIYMEVEKKIFLSFKHISIFTLLCTMLHNKDWEAGKCLFEPSPSNTGSFLWPDSLIQRP